MEAVAFFAGAIGAYLREQGDDPTGKEIRAMVPVSVRNDATGAAPGNHVSSYFVDLPIGEGNPVMRLHQVSFAMRGHKDSGQSIGADAITRQVPVARSNAAPSSSVT